MSDPYVRYDYAWKTPGFTVQNPVINYGADGYVEPGMPADVTMVHLYGSFMEMDTGRDLEGVLRLRTDKILTHIPSGRQVMGGALKPVRFNHRGFSIWLPATDDPQLAPSFRYEAKLTVRGVVQEFSFLLPSSEPEVNITTLINRYLQEQPVEVGGGDSDGEFEMGTDPRPLTVNLTTGAVFTSTLNTDVVWDAGTTSRLVFATGEVWDAVVDGTTITFDVPAVEADEIAHGTKAILFVNDEAWAVGSVTRHA